MKKFMYTLLSILSICFIGLLAFNEFTKRSGWDPNFGNWQKVIEYILSFGAVAIIVVYALINFSGNPLKLVFLVLLIIVVALYLVAMFAPDFIYNIFTDIFLSVNGSFLS
ncbi:MAG: hypothetical protein IJ008_02690 [Clostridia bacterium]|nr:hypothetical protein [Clostridia bacterium]